MFRMEIDSSPESGSPSHYDLIIQRLSKLGVPEHNLKEGQRGLVTFAKDHKLHLRALLSAILTTDEEEVDEDVFHESLIWLQWLMFEDEPESALDHLSKSSANQRGVCGGVWRENDIAYRCRTCEHDPTCAICVPCFENGNHNGHDYSIIYTGGGCCDCGDVTAWKREGFCSNHKGAEQIQPLPENISTSLGPVLDFLLNYWKDKLIYAKIVSEESPTVPDNVTEIQKADELTSVMLDMLLDFCKHSESLLSFISGRVYSSTGVLDILLRAERFLNDGVVVKLHELLLKLLGEPTFKYEFAKVFAVYYPSVVSTIASEGSDTAFKKCPLVSTFSVQILTVPTLTPGLVEEIDLMAVLLQSLGSIFSSCVGEDGRLQVTKWGNLYETTQRVVEDIRFVMSHSAVPRYLCHNRRELVRTWMKLLASVQGMNSVKRETGSHIEDENENVHFPFILCHSISNIQSLLVAGAFSNKDIKDETFSSSYKTVCEDQDSLRHAKVGKLSQESSIGSVTGKSSLDHLPIPSSALWFTYECLRSIENWLESDNMVGPLNISSRETNYVSGKNILALKRTLSKFRRSRYFKLSPSHDDSTLVQEACDDNMTDGESTSDLEGLRVLSVSEWPDISYDVSSQAVSVHIPLHQVLSMVLRRALKECCEESESSSYLMRSNFLERVLEGCHPYGFSGYVMEHPLRIRVFCAQVHAGMWRRNGDAPMLLGEWYRLVRWSEQGLELDLFLLQCCAALAPPDLYVHRILERFGLSNYLSLNLEQNSEHEPTLVAEMLNLLVQIVKERRYCGLSSAECLQREFVYKLSIGDATRSQLVKSLPRDLSKIDQLQQVLDTVAEYSHPSGMNQGMYKLRASYWKELDLYHPRWNSRDRQSAEERYLRVCNVSALTTQLPKWTKIYYPLKGIAKIATCKMLLQIIRSVMFYAVFADKRTPSRAAPDNVLTALHLLALALDVCRAHKESSDPSCYVGDVIPLLAFASEEICTSKYGDQSLFSLLVLLMKMHEKESYDNFMEAGSFSLSALILNLIKTFVDLEPGFATKLEKLAPQLADQFLHSVLKGNVKDTGSVSDAEKRKAKSRERQAAILEKMRAEQSKFLESFNSNEDEEMNDAKSEQEEEVCDAEITSDSAESSEAICSLCHDPESRKPVSFLVLLQKSRLLTFVNREPLTWEQAGRSGKEHVSDSTTSKDVTSSSIANDSKTIKSSQLVESIQNAVNDFACSGQPKEVNSFIEYVKARFPSIKSAELHSISEDARERTAPSLEKWEEDFYSLIRGSSSGSNKLDSEKNDERCSTSLLLGKYIAGLPKETLDRPSASQTESNRVHQGYDKFGPSGGDGIYVSSCGHAVHQSCLDRYLSSLKERYIRRIVFEGGHIVDPDQGEFLCPVCRGLANSVLPALPGNSRKIPQSLSSSTNTNMVDASLHLQNGLSFLQRAANIAGNTEILNAFPTRNVKIPPNIEPTVNLLCGMYYPNEDKILETGRVHPSLILWDTLKYSLISAEIATRSRKNSLSPNYSLDSLYKELNSSTGFILSMLLNVTQSTHTTNSLSVLLRLRGMQLFAKSLCYGNSSDAAINQSCHQGGNMVCILENDEEVPYLDVQLWKRANEPILAHDAFSSLMWTLYCLPRPVLSCKESLLALLHVFYVVTVVQAIHTHCKRSPSINTDLVLRDSLITDIYQLMRRCDEAVQCLDYNNVDHVYDFNNSIRSLTFPYLRRCALLWKLINCSNSMPFSYGSTDGLESTVGIVKELTEIEKLEKMFNIPSLEIIFNDEKSRSTALRWFADFPETQKTSVLRCSSAVPLKLILLPHLYQDLLQRYIKKCCADCGAVKNDPALCLLCGKLCSPHWKPCCRESGCETHAMTCGAGIGVFLLIRKTTILLQRSARKTSWASPYLDAFGEEDVEMSRGKPLFLNEERYAALTHMVASHGLDRSSKVLRQTTVGAFLMF